MASTRTVTPKHSDESLSKPSSLHETTGRLDGICDKPEVLRCQIGVINTVHKQQASGIRIQGLEKYMANFFCA